MKVNTEAEADRLVSSLAFQYKILNWSWLILSIILIISCAGIIAGVWNLYVLRGLWKVPQMIRSKSPAVVSIFQDGGNLIAFLLINIALGGAVGALLIAYEYFFIRPKVLENRHVFEAYGQAGPR